MQYKLLKETANKLFKTREILKISRIIITLQHPIYGRTNVMHLCPLIEGLQNASRTREGIAHSIRIYSLMFAFNISHVI